VYQQGRRYRVEPQRVRELLNIADDVVNTEQEESNTENKDSKDTRREGRKKEVKETRKTEMNR
jgi:hypothetical protein